MNRVHVRFTKWDGSLHWHFDTVRLGDDAHGVWLGGGPGTPVRRGSEPAIIISPPFALLIPAEGWWTATFNPESGGSPFEYVIYVDICTPPEWDGDTVSAVDLDLDVAMRVDGTVAMLDEDEFEEHRIAMAYPAHIADQARASAAARFTTIEASGEPFATIGFRWLQQAMRLV